MPFFKLLILHLAVIACASKSPSGPSESERLNQFLDNEFKTTLLHHPEFETYVGEKHNYALLEDHSEAFAQSEFERSQKLLEQLKKFKTKNLNDEALISYRLMENQLKLDIEGYQYRYYHFPLNQMFGFQAEFPSFMISMHLIHSKQDAHDYIARINKVQKKFDQLLLHIGDMKKLGIIAPRFVYAKVINDSQNILKGRPFQKSNKDSVLLEDFNKKIEKLKDLDQAEKKSLSKNLEIALVNVLQPAYKKLISFTKDLETQSQIESGAWMLPNGEQFYQYMLRAHTSTNLTADEIHELGLSEVKRIHSEMHDLMKKLNYKSEKLQDFFSYVNDASMLKYPATKTGKEQYLKDATNLIETMKKNLDQMFGIKPKAELVVQAVEPYREKSAGLAFYSGPSEDGKRPGTYYVNLYDMNAVNKYEMEALAYHEGIPGHHMQISISSELTNIPRFRKYGNYNAYVEGWGLYAEWLPKQYGFYQDPYSDFGRLSMELWRACRLVVDTGIHAKKWTRQQAIDYLNTNTPSPKEENIRAIERYIVMPGQATAYKIGMNKLIELNLKAKKVLGAKFDIRQFHDEVLKYGALPLNILEERIEGWIKKQQN